MSSSSSPSSIDATKIVYLIVHGQKQLLEQVKNKLTTRGFKKENMHQASLDKAGNDGEYVAMIWPPMSPEEIIVSQIDNTLVSHGKGTGMGAWASVGQKEIYRISLK